ncbi:MAG TPA: hypothetical protein VGF27_00100 [Pseudoduganella sp.]
MYRFLARLLLCLIVAALPLQGALAAMRVCADNPVKPAAQQHHQDYQHGQQQHDHVDKHDKADSHGKCSTCAGCCAGTAPPAGPLTVQAPDASFSIYTPGQSRVPGFVPDTPTRPPRACA